MSEDYYFLSLLKDELTYEINIRGDEPAKTVEGMKKQLRKLFKASQGHNTNKKCLVSILSCNNWDITTVEGVGNRKEGYHKIQERLANFNGTQCGYCTPGWVLNMYSLTQSKPSVTMKEVENSFGSNLCRCTGYRPILDAFKSLASDASEQLKAKIVDVEDLGFQVCLRKSKSKTENREIDYVKTIKSLQFEEFKWYKVYTLADILKIFETEGTESYRLVAGNTGHGVYEFEEYPKILIDISSVEELQESIIDVNLILSANISLTEAIDLFDKYSKSEEYFAYLSQFKEHFDKIAHIPVRNIGTLAGNLMLKHHHNEFESDIFLIFETVGAMMTIVDKNNVRKDYSLAEFLNLDMMGKIILNFKLPPLPKSVLLRTYKITPRAQNAHAIVNAGFLFELQKDLIQRVRIVYGGINPKFIHAKDTEKYLEGKMLFDDETLAGAIDTLSSEVYPDERSGSFNPTYRKFLTQGLFYKTVLSFCPRDRINSRIISGGVIYDRPVSKGIQTYDTDKKLWPLGKPIPKLEALLQCSGEAKFTNDLPTLPGEVYATFVLSTVANGEIDAINTAGALKIPGVEAFYSHLDIPGVNSFTPPQFINEGSEEEILCSSKVLYYGQPIGIIVANSEKLANYAAKSVEVTYKNTKSPVLKIKEAILAPKKDNRVVKDVEIAAKSKGQDVAKIITGSYEIKGQYHFTMETQTCVVVPDEDNLVVYSATQFMDFVQIAIARCLNIPENRIHMIVRRLGGGYGAKASRSGLIATACAIVAKRLNRPARFVLSLDTNMQAVGKRLPFYSEYEVAVNKSGSIQYANIKFWEDDGCSHNDKIASDTPSVMKYLYDTSSWTIQGYSVLTDTASNTWCRAPGTLEGAAIIEHLMEKISSSLNLDAFQVRLNNLATGSTILKEMVSDFKIKIEFSNREQSVLKFNNENKWKKRGLGLSLMSYPIFAGKLYYASLSIYHGDGSMTVSHGGIEMGQGINTKIAQVVAYKLGVPLEKINVKHTDNFTSPNVLPTSGSIGSESVSYAAIKACEILQARINPYKKEGDSWEKVIKEAYDNNVDLHASYLLNGAEGLTEYAVHGIGVIEVELDVLTGISQVLRVDILEDVGMSMSPEVDVGQIEGALIMGLGYWTSEELKYDSKSGKLLTTRTWNYKPPGAKDIPIDMRIHFKENSGNAVGVLSSKATGEPAIILAVAVTHALRKAVESARKEQGYENNWIDIANPCTPENILIATNPDIKQYKLQDSCSPVYKAEDNRLDNKVWEQCCLQ